MNKKLSFALCASYAVISCAQSQVVKPLPNIVFILADDLGYGDLSCYGQKRFSTPNIDAIAGKGMLFRQHYTGCTVSAPSRSSLMTGLHTGHTPVRGNMEFKPEGQFPLPASSVTIAEILKSKGYSTGAFGKWGLGFITTEGDPNAQGFDDFFGYNCQGLAHNYYPDHLWNNHQKIVLSANENGKKGAYSADLIQKAALNFINKNKNNPFFLFYPATIPHAELFAKEEYLEKFRGKYDPEKSYKGTDSGPSFRLGPYGSQPEAHASFAAMVTQLDDYIGEILKTLEELGLENNTIIVFASDNGPHLEGGADPDYFNSNGSLRGYKRDLYEGGIRTPLIVKWPGKVKQGSVNDHISAFWDMLPTFADISGADSPKGIDGISFLPSLLGKKQPEHHYLYWEFHEQGGKRAIRMGKWKAVTLNADDKSLAVTELYDLSVDQSETTNISSANPEIVLELENLMKLAHVKSDSFPFKFESTAKDK